MRVIRAYQERAVAEIAQAMREGCRSLVYALATGGGKTVIAAELIRRAHGKARRQLFLVHRRELVRQAFDTLSDILGAGEVGVIAAGWPPLPWAMTQVASIQTFIRRLHQMPDFDVIYFDEVHHARAGTWQRVIQRWPRVHKVGLTATPERLDGKGLGLDFERLIQGPDTPALIRDGFLAPIDTLRVTAAFAAAARQASDGSRVQVANVADLYHRYAPGRRCIYFGLRRARSEDVVEAVRALGYNAAHVEGDSDPDYRDRTMAGFRSGDIDFVGNVDIISEGFDAPACDTIIFDLPTRSLTRYLQAVGRAMRPAPGKRALLIDASGCSRWLGDPDMARTWTLEDGHVREPREAGRPRAERGPSGPDLEFEEVVDGSRARRRGGRLRAAAAGAAQARPQAATEGDPAQAGGAHRRGEELGRSDCSARRARGAARLQARLGRAHGTHSRDGGEGMSEESKVEYYGIGDPEVLVHGGS